MNAYRYRDGNLLRLGFASYAEYLASPLWKSIRVRVLARQEKCPKCQKPPYQVHHTDYGMAVLGGRTLIGLIALCRDCHEWVEFCQETGRKLSLPEANQKLHALIGDLHAVGRPHRRMGKKEIRERRVFDPTASPVPVVSAEERAKRTHKIERLPLGRNGRCVKKIARNLTMEHVAIADAAKRKLVQHREAGLLPHQQAARGRVF